MLEEKNVNTRVDRDGIPMVMTTKEYLGDACGNAATNCLSQVAGQLTYFYTDKVGMAASTASFVQMLATLCDGVSDIIMGRIVDKTNTKEGKCRPWLKWMIIPLFLGIVLLTTVPKASPMIINTSEYNDFKYGYRLSGLTNSAASFGGKVGAAIGQVILGMVLAAGGYDAALPIQPDTALKAICRCSIDMIGVALIVMLICFIAYTFDKEYPVMLKANIERRAAGKSE